MDKEQLIEKISAFKKDITSLGHQYLKDRMPIEVNDFRKKMNPFIILEKAFDKAIKKINNEKSFL